MAARQALAAAEADAAEFSRVHGARRVRMRGESGPPDVPALGLGAAGLKSERKDVAGERLKATA